ncbi:MAG: GNAT family N-acetyltransferase [Candidatus Hermodarchaeota archaeon]
MNIRLYESKDKKNVIKLIGMFRIRTAQLKGIEKEIDLQNAEEELEYYLKQDYPIYIAEDNELNLIGYHVFRVENEIVWSESLYVIPEMRRKGIGSKLYEEAEKLVEKLGGITVYNWVHPNNDMSIPFLKKRGYNVLNLIEIRKRRPNEKFSQEIKVGKYEFNY